jgi:hypothetical protein
MSPRSMTPRPGDQTAIQKQKLEREHAEELAERQRELAMVAQAEADQQRQAETVDYFESASQPLDEPEIRADEDSEERMWVIRVLLPIEQMCFGRAIVKEPKYNEQGEMTDFPVLGSVRLYDFEEGRRYRVPREMALHLIDKGLAARDRVAP